MKKIIIISFSIVLTSLWAADGAKIFKKTCSVCHGDRAQKSSLKVSKIIAGWPAEKIVEKLKAYKSGKLNQYGFGNMMRNRATKLTDEEMMAVAKYIESLKKTK
ncbi:c-type cytochrome [Nitrosophilus alvini]|uniref:c-type cytochrome n=1 Tax=Nitrosophilus alvini TaxID=2714855 RepID=UPI00190B62A4|nr:c-type cytochrome [Nitrosophilus alvini]